MPMRLSPGMEISHWDSGARGRPEAQIATVIRARGQGVRVERDGGQYTVPRSDVIRVMPGPSTVTVPARRCRSCQKSKPETEFYSRADDRCKPCFRDRVDRANRASGRQSMSLGRAEVVWLQALLGRLRRMPSVSGTMSQPEAASVVRKLDGMAMRGAEKMKGTD